MANSDRSPSAGDLGVDFIPYGHQRVDDDDIAAVAAVLRSDWLTTGPAVEDFEDRLTGVTGARFAVAFCNGTAALHAACAVAGLGPGDRVATSTLSFVASANCIRHVGAEPVLLDVDRTTRNLDITAFNALMDDKALTGLVAVHFGGLPLDLVEINRPRILIEDAAHALGARSLSGPVGNCANSDMCCFSFHPVKAITTGEGGAVTTNSRTLAESLRRFRNHGITPTPDLGGWAYDVDAPGWNYRLTDLQAALGASQLSKLESFINRRNELAARYDQLLRDLPVGVPPSAPEGMHHAWHLYPIEVPDRNRVYNAMRAAGIGVQVHYRPIHLMSAYRGPESASLPVAELVSACLLSLPLFPGLSDRLQDRVVEDLSRAL